MPKSKPHKDKITKKEEAPQSKPTIEDEPEETEQRGVLLDDVGMGCG